MPPANPQPIPPNILGPIQQAGFDQTLLGDMPYANGVMAVLSGQTQDVNIITQELRTAFTNTGLGPDGMAAYLKALDDNVTALVLPNPAIAHEAQFLRVLYFTLAMEFVKSFGTNARYTAGESIQTRGLPAVYEIEPFTKNEYAIHVMNPNGMQGTLSPWFYVYNDGGNAKLFLSKEEMEQYDKKYGKHLNVFFAKIFDKDNLQYTGIAAICVIGVLVATVIFVKKRLDKRKEAQERFASEIEAFATEDTSDA